MQQQLIQAKQHTNGADDGSTTVVLVWDHLGMKLGEPFQLHPVGEVVEGVGGSSHCERTTDCL